MTVISSREFAANQTKYFKMAVNEEVAIKRGSGMFHLVYRPIENIPEQLVLESDDDLRRAITIDELREKMHTRIHELFAKNESISNS